VKHWRVMSVCAVIAIGLAGCAAPTAPAPTASVSVTPSPSTVATPSSSPQPTVEADPLADGATLVMRPTALEVQSASGEIVHYLDYLSSASDAAATLTEVLGAAPVDTQVTGNNHFPPQIQHAWGAFSLFEQQYPDNWAQVDHPSAGRPSFRVFFDGTTSEDVPLAAAVDVRAGGAWADAQAADLGFWVCEGTPVDAIPGEGWGGTTARVSVAARPSEDGAAVRWLVAPAVETDGCA